MLNSLVNFRRRRARCVSARINLILLPLIRRETTTRFAAQ
jgi:hypothetical protein